MNRAQELIKRKPYLIWYTATYDQLDDAPIIEAVLNYGDWEDVQDIIKILGIKRVSEIFHTYAFRARTNYFPQIQNYFSLYFDKYVPR